VPEPLREKLARAQRAREKPPALGPPVETGDLTGADQGPSPAGLGGLTGSQQADARRAGVTAGGEDRAGTFFLLNRHLVCADSREEGLEVTETARALERHPWLAGLLWEAVAPDTDRYTAATALDPSGGYFIRALPGTRSRRPVQACLYLGQDRFRQQVHNVVVAEEGSELHVITGCTSSRQVERGFHVGVSEFWVRRGATLTFTMVHAWGPGVEVRPRTGIVLEEGAVFISNFICLDPVRTLQMFPTAWLRGAGARARFLSVIRAGGDSLLDTGARVVLQAPDTRAEVINRAVADDRSVVVARGELRGEFPGARGHLECQGLILSPDAAMTAVPELTALTRDLELSHEAAVGKISQEEILYLTARGLSPDEAVALIVRGFLNVSLEGLPPELEAETRRLMTPGANRPA
jgi:hypothetical protein